MQRKGEMGLGTLIIFIALILVAGIVATVLMQTSSTLQGETMLSAEDSKSHMSTAMKVIDVTLHKDQSGEYRNLEAVIKLVEGSETIIVNDMAILLKLKDSTISLGYRGVGSTFDNSVTGFKTPVSEEMGEAGIYFSKPTANVGTVWSNIPSVDYDLDGSPDRNKICCSGGCPDPTKNTNQGWIAVNVSSYGLIYVQVKNSVGAAIPLCSGLGGTAAVTKAPVGSFGYMSIIGAVSGIGSIVPDRISYYLMEEYLNQDLDNDGDYDDQIAVNRTHVIFFWTNGDTDIIPLGVDLSSGPALISIDQAEIGSPAKGFLTVSGTTSRANYIDDYMTFNVEPPGEIGYFSATYLQESQNHIEGYIQYGDVARLGMQLPRQLTDSEELILQIIPNEGMPVELNIITPEVLSASKIKLFP